MIHVCPHCKAPSTEKIEHGRIHCPACEGWFQALRSEPQPATVTTPARPKPEARPMRRRLEQPTRELPPGMVSMGFRLDEFDDGTMYAVSAQWGCTERHTDLEALIAQSRQIVRALKYINKKRQEEQER